MRQSEILVRELERLRNKLDRLDLHILETGSIRNTGEPYRLGDGWSTLTFAQQVASHGGTATSIDLNVDAAKQVLSDRGLERQVTLLPGHSIDLMAALLAASATRFDLILLDSDNDPNLILHEYFIAKRLLRGGGVIVVDDVDPQSATVMKGHALQPWLDEHQISYHIQRRQGNGFTTGMMVIG